MCGRDIRADGLCRLAPPLTCYGCNFFAAFRDGPHLEVRNALVQIIEYLRESADSRISMQLDNALSAVNQLIAQIDRETKEAIDAPASV